MLWLWSIVGVGATPAVSTGDTGGPPVGVTTGDTGSPPETAIDPTTDADGDGYTLGEGDCDDDDAQAYPGRGEVCGDRVDNNCDGLFDGGCDDAVHLASMGGGGGCTGGGGIAGTQGAVATFSLLFWLWRNRWVRPVPIRANRRTR